MSLVSVPQQVTQFLYISYYRIINLPLVDYAHPYHRIINLPLVDYAHSYNRIIHLPPGGDYARPTL